MQNEIALPVTQVSPRHTMTHPSMCGDCGCPATMTPQGSVHPPRFSCAIICLRVACLFRQSS